MSNLRKGHDESKLKNTITALRDNGFKTIYVTNKKEAILEVSNLVSSQDLVGLGGSVTIREIGLDKFLKERGNAVADHWEARRKGASHDEIREIRMLHINSDVFITSTNAITETGQLVNIDGTGQRVAAMIFGPRRVIVISGTNKIVKDQETGMWRARNVAAPMNAKRLKRNTPCTLTGVCSDCDSEERICNATTIIHRRPRDTDITVILIGEELGY